MTKIGFFQENNFSHTFIHLTGYQTVKRVKNSNMIWTKSILMLSEARLKYFKGMFSHEIW